ncbi:MAG: twin transmembrane helix small protein [Pseudomonadota bacterium]
MTAAPTIITVVAAIAVGVVLVMGLVNMMRAGSNSVSQKLMRWRVGLQFAAVVIAMVVFYLAR